VRRITYSATAPRLLSAEELETLLSTLEIVERKMQGEVGSRKKRL